MALPAPHLDDRRFQDIVDEAKRMIPRLCPAWTDHNVSDPGIALVELFAWMTETLLYRVNQIPEKAYIHFLDLIGITLHPPQSASAAVTFYLSGPQPEKTIDAGTEVATMRTETAPAIVFTTDDDLTIRPPVLEAAFSHRGAAGDHGWTRLEAERLDLPQHSMILFPLHPADGDAFYLALKDDHSHHVLALVAGCKSLEGTGVNPKDPPIVWEAWQGSLAGWARCIVEHEGTDGFTKDGEIVMRVPPMQPRELAGRRAYWIRARISAEGRPGYEVSPEIERYCRLESRGGTVTARHAVTVTNEAIGQSDGGAGQAFKLIHAPILSGDPDTDHLVVRPPDQEPQAWREVPDFGDTGRDDRCYTLDRLDGTLTFGPSLPQPDGSQRHFGAVPPRGSMLTFSRYQYGGGGVGNVPAGAITVLKSSIPYVKNVVNHDAAIGGRDAQTLADAKLEAVRKLRSQERAVTAEDYEYHALKAGGRSVARAHCLTPGSQPGDAYAIPPGQVFVLVLPRVDAGERPSPGQLVLSDDLRRHVLNYLLARSVIGIGVEVRMPDITWVSVTAELVVAERATADLIARVQRDAEEQLYRYLNPYVGGPSGDGWPFGRTLHLSEIYSRLQRLRNVEYVQGVQLEIQTPGGSPQPAAKVAIPKHGLICSAVHLVQVRRRREGDD